MDLRISKKTAKSTQKLIATIVGFMLEKNESGNLEIDKKGLDIFQLTQDDIEEISKLYLNIDKQLKTK